MNTDWYLKYIGRPWAGIPDPPHSYTCGELVRSVYRDFFSVELVPIPVPDASNLRQVITAMVPSYFGFEPVSDGEMPQDFDCVFLSRRHVMDHCGLAVTTSEGLQILHCANPCGVVLNSSMELKNEYGYTGMFWYRHPEVRKICQR